MIIEQISPESSDLRDALGASDLPIDDLTDIGRTFFRFVKDGRTVGFGGYERYEDTVLLRSSTINPEFRGRGLGRAVIAGLMDRVAADGVHDIYLLTTSAAEFFERIGFLRVDRASAPASILATRQATSLCPASAVLLYSSVGARAKF